MNVRHFRDFIAAQFPENQDFLDETLPENLEEDGSYRRWLVPGQIPVYYSYIFAQYVESRYSVTEEELDEFIRAGLNLNVRSCFFTGKIDLTTLPLEAFAMFRNNEMIELLISRGANPNLGMVAEHCIQGTYGGAEEEIEAIQETLDLLIRLGMTVLRVGAQYRDGDFATFRDELPEYYARITWV